MRSLALALAVFPVLAVTAVAASGCAPSSIDEAERKGNVAWLDQNGTPAAVEALGRLADKDPKARSALEARSTFDAEAFRAAWAAVRRGASWGTTLFHGALLDPKRADLAASAMDRHDPHLPAFAADLEQALVRLSATIQNFNVASTLASLGAPGHDAVVRRLTDPSTRGAMCRGVASPDASHESRDALLTAPVADRNSDDCVDAVVALAAADEPVLVWLGEQGEPGLLGAAGKEEILPCPKLHFAWTKALAKRTVDVYPALTVPLGYAMKRCAAEMDGVVADAITHLPATHSFVVEAIDPYDGYGKALHATCAALPLVASGGRDTPVIRERANDALNHGCKAPG
ncbi:MAG TPA: hypothetical protein VIY73_24450 [Polyangiaceae bacterium]